MKPKIITLILLLLLVIVPDHAYAHVLKSSGSIGAVMHIQPEDDPIAGEISSFFFEFKDKNNKFSAQECTCLIAIYKGDEEVFFQPLFQDHSEPSLTNASVHYTFPERGVYTIKVMGTPKDEPIFEPFTLEYDIRVERVSGSQNSAGGSNWFMDHIPHLIGGFIGFAALGFILFKGRKSGEKN